MMKWAGYDDAPEFWIRWTELPSVNRMLRGLNLTAVRARKLLIVMAILMVLTGLAAFRTQIDASFVHTLKRVGNAAEIYGRVPLWSRTQLYVRKEQ
jgi:hypothetical protein